MAVAEPVFINKKTNKMKAALIGLLQSGKSTILASLCGKAMPSAGCGGD